VTAEKILGTCDKASRKKTKVKVDAVTFGEAWHGKAAEHRVCLAFFGSFCGRAKRTRH
jgi:hypothetical protein